MKHQLLTVAIVLTGAFQLHARDKVNILFMLSDDHAVQSIGCLGTLFEKYDPTPHLDRLAGEGTRFDACITPNAAAS